MLQTVMIFNVLEYNMTELPIINGNLPVPKVCISLGPYTLNYL